jgi:hypothetical protein
MSPRSTLQTTHSRLATLASGIAVVAIACATVVGLARTVFADGTPGEASVSAQQRTLLAHALDRDAHRGMKVRLKHWMAPRVPRPKRQLAPPPVTVAISSTSTTPIANGSSLPETSDDGNSHDE